MFNRDFFPTPPEVAARMLDSLQLAGATVWEPSAGKGNLIKEIQAIGADVIACEKDPDLKKIVEALCPVINSDMLQVTSDQISHVRYIVMNPPFSADEQHIAHAWEIAPPGCKIVSLCNTGTLEKSYTRSREKLQAIVEHHGTREDLGDCFSQTERGTKVNVSLLILVKPGAGYNTEFEGFFMEDDEEEPQENALMSYNVVRDLVNRYVEAVKIYDQQLETAVRLNNLTAGHFFGVDDRIAITVSQDKAPVNRAQFKKAMQKAGWNWIFNKMNLQKYATRGLKEDINKFVEQQQEIPFTMKNIYRMLEIVVGTTKQRMDKAILEVFEKITSQPGSQSVLFSFKVA